MNDEERDELLIRVDERVCMILKELLPAVSKRISRHSKYHWAIGIPIGLALLGLLIKLLV